MTAKTIEVKGPKKPERQTEAEKAAPDNAQEEAAAPPVETETPPAVSDAEEAASAARETRDLTEHLQRLAAEFENYKKRAAREMAQAQEIGKARVLEATLPVLDSLDRSLAQVADGQDAAAWREGLQRIRQQLREALEKQGLAAIPAEPGAPLDPNIHEVMLAQPDAEIPADHILQIYQVGYKLNDRLLRPAKVIVARAVEPQAAPAEQESNHE